MQNVSTIGSNVRRVDCVYIKGSLSRSELRTFFTDASGQVINEVSGLLETGWAVVEVKLQNKILQKVREWGKKLQGQPSVQRCEAMAILEVMQQVTQGSRVQVHTDSKVTVQAIRSMCTKVYKKKES